MRAAMAWPSCFETHRSAPRRWARLWSHLRRDAPQHEGVRDRHPGSRKEPTCGCGKRSLVRLACFRPVIYRERRNFNVPSHKARSADLTPPAASPCIFSCYLQERLSCVRRTGGRTRFPRGRRRDSMMPAEAKPGTAMTTETIIVERRRRVGIVRLNRPQALNALNATLRNELLSAVEAFDADADVGCILITGSDKAFAAGADIKEMADKSYIDIFRADYA